MKPNIQSWKIEKIVPYLKNAKKHPKEQVAKIAASIKQFGWTQPIVVDQNGVVIAGHGRRLAAISLGLEEAPVWIRDDLDEQQVNALRLADNRVAQSDFDTTLLQDELRNLSYDLDGIFDKKELDFFAAEMTTLNEDAFVLDLDAEVKKQGEETLATLKEIASRDVKIQDAVGFKTIKGKDERAIVRWISMIEEATGLIGAEAFAEHARAYAEISHD